MESVPSMAVSGTSLEVIEERLQHWQHSLAVAEQAREFALRQVENCLQMKRLVAGEAQLVLIKGDL